MKPKINISPGMIVFILGFCGLVFLLVENTGEIGSKIPLAVFFIFIICLGVIIEMMPQDKLDDMFGEVEGGREIA